MNWPWNYMNVVLGGLYSTLIVKEKFSGVLNSEKKFF